MNPFTEVVSDAIAMSRGTDLSFGMLRVDGVSSDAFDDAFDDDCEESCLKSDERSAASSRHRTHPGLLTTMMSASWSLHSAPALIGSSNDSSETNLLKGASNTVGMIWVTSRLTVVKNDRNSDAIATSGQTQVAKIE